MKKYIFFLLLIISLNSFSQTPIPYTNKSKKDIFGASRPVYIYVDSLNLNRLSKEDYSYIEPFDQKNGLAIVRLRKTQTSRDRGIENYHEAQLINKLFEVIFSIRFRDEIDGDKVLRKIYDSDGSFVYQYCEVAHYQDKDHYIDDRYGLIGSNGKKITNAKYSNIIVFSEGVAVIENQANQYGFIDKNGVETLPPTFFTSPFSYMNGRSLLQTELGYVYVDKFGRELGKANSTTNYTFSDGLYKITDDEKYSIFKNKLGKTILTLPYRTIGNFNKNEVICFVGFDKNKKKKVGLINLKGSIILPPKFNLDPFNGRYGYGEAKQFSNEFHDGLAAVQTENGWGFINTKGQLIIQDKYSDVSAFSEGLAVVKDLFGWSIINKKGETVVSYNQLKILNNSFQAGFMNFENGFLTVILRGFGYYYIDKSGRELIQK